MISFDAKAGRYRNSKGQFIKRAEVDRVHELEVKRLETRLTGITRLYQSGKIDINDWEKQFKQTLKTGTLNSYALGKGGKNNLSFADYGRAGQHLRQQYQFLNNYRSQLLGGTISPKMALARSKNYGRGIRTIRNIAEKAERISAGVQLAKRSLTPGYKHCTDCLRLATASYVPIENVTPPGVACVCGFNCKCVIQYKAVKSNSFSLTPNILTEAL